MHALISECGREAVENLKRECLSTNGGFKGRGVSREAWAQALYPRPKLMRLY